MKQYPNPSKKKKSHMVLPSKNLRVCGKLCWGNFGLVSQVSAYIRPEELESGRRVLIRYFRKFNKNKSKLWIRVFPFHSYTKKPSEVRMGKGKGTHKRWVYPIQPGKVIFEIIGLKEFLAKSALKEVSSKLRVNTKIIKKD